MFWNLYPDDVTSLRTEVQTVHAARAATHTHTTTYTYTTTPTSQTEDVTLRSFTTYPVRTSSLSDKHPETDRLAMVDVKDIHEDDLVQTEWENYCEEPIERHLCVNCFPETEERRVKCMAFAVYQGVVLTEEGSKEHHKQLVELLRRLHPVMLYDTWLKDYTMTDAVRGLTTIHPLQKRKGPKLPLL